MLLIPKYAIITFNEKPHVNAEPVFFKCFYILSITDNQINIHKLKTNVLFMIILLKEICT